MPRSCRFPLDESKDAKTATNHTHAPVLAGLPRDGGNPSTDNWFGRRHRLPLKI
jgi:hypothetical protein